MTEIEAKEIVRKEKAYMDSHAGRAQSEAFQMAINALEKQIVKKIITPPCNTCDKELCDCECEHFAVTCCGGEETINKVIYGRLKGE